MYKIFLSLMLCFSLRAGDALPMLLQSENSNRAIPLLYAGVGLASLFVLNQINHQGLDKTMPRVAEFLNKIPESMNYWLKQSNTLASMCIHEYSMQHIFASLMNSNCGGFFGANPLSFQYSMGVTAAEVMVILRSFVNKPSKKPNFNKELLGFMVWSVRSLLNQWFVNRYPIFGNLIIDDISNRIVFHSSAFVLGAIMGKIKPYKSIVDKSESVKFLWAGFFFMKTFLLHFIVIFILHKCSAKPVFI
jgi:hypothetical protein